MIFLRIATSATLAAALKEKFIVDQMAALNLKTMQELQKNCIECAALQMGLQKH